MLAAFEDKITHQFGILRQREVSTGSRVHRPAVERLLQSRNARLQHVRDGIAAGRRLLRALERVDQGGGCCGNLAGLIPYGAVADAAQGGQPGRRPLRIPGVGDDEPKGQIFDLLA
jgi:hypothetical protein